VKKNKLYNIVHINLCSKCSKKFKNSRAECYNNWFWQETGRNRRPIVGVYWKCIYTQFL